MFMKLDWFESWGGYISWVDWLLVGLTIAFLTAIFLTVDSQSHSVSDRFYGVPYFFPTLMALYSIASKTSIANS
jgi:hypothetical protein